MILTFLIKILDLMVQTGPATGELLVHMKLLQQKQLGTGHKVSITKFQIIGVIHTPFFKLSCN